jgi:site-specific recombinase XerD
VVVKHAKREAARVQKVREVPFTKASRVAVERWLNLRSEILRAHKVADHGSVWLALINPRPCQPMRYRRFQGIMTTVGKGYSLHRFRHTCATNWLRAGVELPLVSRMLGHSTLQQTLCYAEIVRDDIHAAMHKHEEAFERLANAEEATPDDRREKENEQ